MTIINPVKIGVYTEIQSILFKTVVSSVIEVLKDDSEVASWVRDGITIHKDRNTKTCQFCNRPLPPYRLKELEAHFNDEYIRFMLEINVKIQEITNFIAELNNLQLPKKGEFYDDLSIDFMQIEAQFNQAKKTVVSSLNKINDILSEKKSAMFESTAFTEHTPSYNSGSITTINNLIQKHNTVCDEFNERVLKARKDLEKDALITALEEYNKLNSKVTIKQKALQKYIESVNSIRQQIAQLEREIVEHQEPAERLNDDLRRYLGHGELRLEVQETGYRITRGGSLADGISEGEYTAIALLYFLRSLEDRRFDLRHGIVVLDDPVSSLDANALFYAFGFIRERTESANQLFILTHNFSFFRQVRNWFHHLPNQNKKDVNRRPARFFMINCCIEQGKRCAKIEWLDELLEKHESEYHYLFSCVYQAASEQSGTSLKQNYILPNITRRLLEAFMAFRQPQSTGNLWKQLEQIPYDKSTKVRILRFINTHSHHGEIGEPEHDLSILSEAQSVIREVLDLMATIDKDHVNAMISIATEANHDNGEGDQ